MALRCPRPGSASRERLGDARALTAPHRGGFFGPRAGDDVTEVDDGKEVGVAAAGIVIVRLAAVAVVVFDVKFVLDNRDGCLGLARG
jgi:hypothetical protein